MSANQSPSVRWPQLGLLVCMMILAVTIPLSWHRRYTLRPPRPVRVITPAAPLAQSSPTASVQDVDPTEEHVDSVAIAAIEGPSLGWEVVPPSHAPLPGSPFASLILEDPSEGLAESDTVPSEAFDAHAFRRGYADNDAVPVFDARAWPIPEALQPRLLVLQEDKHTCSWSNHVGGVFQSLAGLPDVGHPDAPQLLEQLRLAIDEASTIVTELDDDDVRFHFNAAVYDVARRYDVWAAAGELARTSDRVVSHSIAPFMEAELLNASFAPDLGDQPVRLSAMLAAIEQYEYTRLGDDGEKLAASIQQLAASGDSAHRALASRIDKHYRNANLRVAVSGDLLNRMLPAPQVHASPVDDFLVGVPVCGRSMTRTRLYTRLIPDSDQIRIGMEAWGNVRSDTTATSGPARLFNRGRTAFLVRKLVVVDHEGLQTKRTVAEAVGDSDLVGVATDYDGVPFLGNLIRNVARRQEGERRLEALTATEQKVASTARRQFDGEINPRLTKIAADFRREVWAPMEHLGLEPATIGMSTDRKRVASRLRVGSGQQLAGHTARPRALSDSVMSMQIHESAINNALAQFDLDGQTLNMHELYLRIADKLQREADEVPDSMPANVVIGFAPRDAVRVRCEDGVMQLTLTLTKVAKGARYHWSDLTVRANYQIELDGLQANLVRTGTIELEGNRLRTRDQIALRGVFSKLLSRSTKAPLVPEKLVGDARMKDFEVTQRTIGEGWIGISVGPIRRTAARPATAGQPAAG